MSELYDTTAQDKYKQKEQKLIDREDADIKKLLTYVEFRRFVWKMLTFTGIYRTTFTNNNATYINEGKRQVGLFLLDLVMRANKTAFSQIQLEYYSQSTSEEIIKQKEDLEKGVI